METHPLNCPKCQTDAIYQDRDLWVCTQCTHEWTLDNADEVPSEALTPLEVRDAHGNVLQDGDSVVVIKDLKVKGASSAIKSGTKVKSIRLVDPQRVHDGHNIDCRVEGFGAMQLKSIFVKKA